MAKNRSENQGAGSKGAVITGLVAFVGFVVFCLFYAVSKITQDKSEPAKKPVPQQKITFEEPKSNIKISEMEVTPAIRKQWAAELSRDLAEKAESYRKLIMDQHDVKITGASDQEVNRQKAEFSILQKTCYAISVHAVDSSEMIFKKSTLSTVRAELNDALSNPTNYNFGALNKQAYNTMTYTGGVVTKELKVGDALFTINFDFQNGATHQTRSVFTPYEKPQQKENDNSKSAPIIPGK